MRSDSSHSALTGAAYARSALRLAPRCLTVLLAVGAVLDAASFASRIRALGTDAPAEVRRSNVGLRAGRLTRGWTVRSAAAAIEAAHLFGSAETREVLAAPATPLVLTGIIATQDPHNGFAILGSNTTSTHLYRTGAAAAPGAVLAEVYPDRVIIQRDDERQTLRLPHEGAALGRAIAREPAPRAMGSAAGLSADADDDQFAPPPMLDAAAVSAALAGRRVSIDGQPGIRVMGTEFNQQALSTLGLVAGDVIVQINGEPIGASKANLQQVIQQGGTLLVARDGSYTGLAIDPTSVAAAADRYRADAPH